MDLTTGWCRVGAGEARSPVRTFFSRNRRRRRPGMTARAYPETTGQQVSRGWRFGWIDAVVILAIFVLLWTLVVLSGDIRGRFDELHPPPLSLDVSLIPYYTPRTESRMVIAFAAG